MHSNFICIHIRRQGASSNVFQHINVRICIVYYSTEYTWVYLNQLERKLTILAKGEGGDICFLHLTRLEHDSDFLR